MIPRVVDRLLGLVLLLVLTAACGTGALPSQLTPSSDPPAPVTPAATTPTMSAPTPADTPLPPLGTPPRATLAGLTTGDLPGDPGTFSWDGFVSDAPWIVGPAEGTAPAAGRLSVSFSPAGPQTAWQARWAPLDGTEPGTPVDGGAGTGGAIELRAPEDATAWSLQLVAWFGDGRNATWYWRVEVAP